MLFVNVLLFALVQLCTELHASTVVSHSLPERPSLRIIRGSDAPEHAVPSMAFVTVRKNGTNFNCGGSLVRQQYVLTAAHCLAERGMTVQKVYLGLHKYDRSDPNQTFTFPTQNFKVHSGYRTDTSAAHDVGLIKLPTPATLYPGVVGVASLAAAATLDNTTMGTYTDKRPTMYGWGLTSEKPEKLPKVLQMLTGKAVAYKACKNAKRARNTTLCMSRGDGTLGVACRGDSGSPLILNSVQIGVVSGGSTTPMSCHRSEFAIFARVDFNRKWIDDTIRTWH